ncbi:lipase 3-like [Tribolium madens]|uniref:lipase 3-like n=1 Tax=Tribolium madens TaxID=41895 RepID=UPI001CF72CF1|nr:lipase 3-like [Tribolium madens]
MFNKDIFSLVVIVISSIILVEIFNTSKPKHPDAGLNILQLVEKYGYLIETHEVVTEDGYILTLHRIGQKNNVEKRDPVLFMHGFMQSATDFINLGPGKALSLLLSDRGYDIWLGNTRGTTWSRKHKVFNPDKDGEFWDFSLHEIGIYDNPAFIDYVLNVTGKKSLHYIGYSQGTTTFFILGSEKPKYVKKVKLMTALAPAIYIKNPKGPLLTFLVYFRRLWEILLKFFNFQEFFPRNGLVAHYLKHICNENSMFVDLCLLKIFLLNGYSHEQTNRTLLSLIFSNTPAGVSPKQMMHIVQLMESGNLHQYDLGVAKNCKKYGQKEPPQYNLSKITNPVALYYSSNDWTVNIENIERVVKALPNVVKSYHVPMESFNHNDFIYGQDAPELLYKAVIEEILKY